jgi:diguanylate cyclase (GGDEF)-like protein
MSQRLEGPNPGHAPTAVRRPRRDFAVGLALGLAGFVLHQVQVPVIAAAPGLSLSAVPILVALAFLGPGPGLLAAGLASLAPALSGDAPALLDGVLEVAFASLAFRRVRSMSLAVIAYWAFLGWALDGVRYAWGRGLDAGAWVPISSVQLFQSLLGALVADAAALSSFAGRRAWPESRRSGLRDYLVARSSLAVLAATLLLVVLAVRAADRLQLATALAWLLPMVLVLPATGLLLSVSLSSLAQRVSTWLSGLERAAREVERHASGDLPLEGFEGAVVEVGELAQRLAQLHDVLAHRDEVTGTPNRTAFSERVALAAAQARRSGGGFAVLMADMDRFRAVDARLGRARSDEVLRQVARRLEGCVKPGDVVARVGNDEFAMMVLGLGRMEDAAQLAERVMDAVKAPLAVDGHEALLTATVGIGLYPRDGEDAETLLTNATAAMYVAKQRGQDSYRRYTARISAKDAQRVLVESGLRKGLTQGDFALHYQPVVRLVDGAVEGVEALVRWRRGGALVAPAEFIPVAEASGVIVEIGSWVLRTACAQARAWHAAGHPLSVAVNISARELQQPEFAKRVLREVGASGLLASYVEIEITESAAMQDMDRSVEVLQELRRAGVRVLVDDFGTGYSSLSHLRGLPIDKVKIDKSFVMDLETNPDSAAIAKAVITMAHSLSLPVVAEGVETDAQLAFLRGSGCDAVQGNLFSPPLDPAELEVLLREGRRLARPAAS